MSEQSNGLAEAGPDVERDQITGVYQREDLFRWLEEERRANPGRFQSSWHMIYVNIAGFKEFNDGRGYAEGNRLLHCFGGLLQEVFRTQLVARIYADQFAIVYRGKDVEDRVKRLHDEAQKLRDDFQVWVRAGIYDITKWETTPDVALDYAKTACDMIPSGRQFYSVYSEDLKRQIDRRKYIISHIDEAIERGWVVLYFQPVIRTLSGKICSGEALARWQDPELGMISPGEFVPVLEESGLSYKLARFVINEAAGFISNSERAGMYPIPVSINLSRKDFDEMDPFEEVERAVERYKISRNLLCIEITESTVMEDPDKIKGYMDRFHKAGYEVWMDDFGSAYSSLNALKDFDFDEIKLDMVFMRNFNDRAKKIVASCINMAKDLGIHTLCEGVETREQVDFLREHGCEKIQGFYYSKPRPLAELKDVIDRGGFSYELSVERFLYDEAGRVKIDPDVAGAVFLCKGDAFYPLEVSRPLREGAARLGIPDVQLHQPLEMEDMDFWQKMKTALLNSRASHEKEEVSYFLDGQYYMMTAETVARSNAGCIATVEIRDITESARGLVLSEAGPVAQSLMEMYDCIYRIDLVDKQIEIVLSDFSGEMAGRRFAYDEETMSAFIYWKDRERFRNWVRPENLREMLEDRSQRSYSDLFRLEKADGTRVWEVFTVMRSSDRGSSEAIMCMKPSIYPDSPMAGRAMFMLTEEAEYEKSLEVQSADADASHTAAAANSSSAADRAKLSGVDWPVAQLWDALTDQDGLKIFWKDRQRRIVGVSRGFLDYFGLTSSDTILGKTETECGWHIDDREGLREDEKVLSTGQVSFCVPGQAIVNGTVRNVVTSKFPVYQGGRVAGLIGVFTEAENLQSLLTPDGSGTLMTRVDPDTGVMDFFSWGAGLREYEDNYNRAEEDFCVGVVVASNYWKLYHEFGEKTAEQLAWVVAETIRSELPEGCMIGRADKETFVICTKAAADDLKGWLAHISTLLAETHYVGTYSGMIGTYVAVASRSETSNPVRVIGLALERAQRDQKALEYRNERSAVGTAAAPATPADSIVTLEEVQKRINAMLHTFDFVRLVDPTRQQIIRYDRDGVRRFEHGNCFDVWGTGVPCDNCISLRTLQTKEKLTKFETDGESVFVVTSQYLVVDGRECALEIVAKMNDSSSLGADERGIFIRALANCRAKLYEDSLTGLHNRRYYEEILSEHRAEAIALIDVDDMTQINETYGHLAGDAAIRGAGQTIAAEVRYNDLVRYEGDRFLICFGKISKEALEKKLKKILDQIERLHFEPYPGLHITACAGGVCRKGQVQLLLRDADEALSRAENAPWKVWIIEN